MTKCQLSANAWWNGTNDMVIFKSRVGYKHSDRGDDEDVDVWNDLPVLPDDKTFIIPMIDLPCLTKMSYRKFKSFQFLCEKKEDICNTTLSLDIVIV